MPKFCDDKKNDNIEDKKAHPDGCALKFKYSIHYFYKYSIIIVIIYFHEIVDKKVTNYTPLFHAFCIVCDLPATFRYYLSTFFLSCNLS